MIVTLKSGRKVSLLEYRALRHLGRMARYHDLTLPETARPRWLNDAGLKPEEGIVGVYFPYPGEVTESIVIGTEGLHMERDGTWPFIGYGEIEWVTLPEEFRGEGKLKMTYFTVSLTDGRQCQIRIPKHHWKFSDIPEFMRFLGNVRFDVRRGKVRVRSW
jgi:hypothetical protein